MAPAPRFAGSGAETPLPLRRRRRRHDPCLPRRRRRHAALDADDDALRRSASLLVGLFTFAGETALANRVRPSSRRPGQMEELAPAAPPGVPATDVPSDETASTEEIDAAPVAPIGNAAQVKAKETTRGR